MPTYAPYDEEDYYTIPNQTFAGDRFAPGSEGAVAFDQPSDQGVRYPIALPSNEGRQVGQFGDTTPDLQRALDEMAAQEREKQNPIYTENDLSRIERNTVEDAGNDPQAVQQATRLQGLLEYRNYLAQGMPSSEAMRRAAPKLYFNHPTAMASVVNHIGSSQVPTIQEITGGRLVMNPNGSVHSYIPNPAEPRPIPPEKVVVPPDVKQLQKNKATEIEEARKDVDSAKKRLEKAMSSTEKEVSQDDKIAAANVVIAEKNKLKKKQDEAVVLSTNYLRPNIVGQALQTPSQTNSVMTVKTKAERDALPSGTKYVGPDGVIRTKQ